MSTAVKCDIAFVLPEMCLVVKDKKTLEINAQRFETGCFSILFLSPQNIFIEKNELKLII